MAYPTGLLSLKLAEIDRIALSIKNYCNSASTRLLNNSQPSTLIFDLYIRLKQDRQVLSAAASIPGIVDYAKTQKNDANLDIVAEFTTMLGAIDDATLWIENNFPKDGSGYLLAQTLEATGPVDRMFTPASTGGLRVVLDAIVATIN